MTLPPEREIGRELAGALHHSTGSYELVIAAIAAAAVGFGLDTLLGIRPILTIVFSVAGFIGAAYSLRLTYLQQMETAETDRLARKSAERSAPVNSPGAAASAAQQVRARDERLSGAKRSAPLSQKVLRANASSAAQQAGDV